MQFIKNFIREEEGQDVVEYALVIGLVALGGTVGLAALAGDGGINGLLTAVETALTAAAAGIPNG
jgi:pilus assembly protein Flp/PilA